MRTPNGKCASLGLHQHCTQAPDHSAITRILYKLVPAICTCVQQQGIHTIILKHMDGAVAIGHVTGSFFEFHDLHEVTVGKEPALSLASRVIVLHHPALQCSAYHIF